MIKTKISVWDEIVKIYMDSLFKRLSLFITQNLTCLKISGALKICLGGKVTEYKIPINSESPFTLSFENNGTSGASSTVLLISG